MKLNLPLLATALASASGAAMATEYGVVISTTPIVVQVNLQQRVCSDGQALVQQPTTGGGSLLGAVVGGAVGNSVGGGSGRAAATGLGIIAGSIIGNNAEAAGTPPAVVPTRNCRNTTRLENRVTGYDVVYEYKGQRQTVRMAQAPGERVELNLTVAGALPANEPSVESTPPPMQPYSEAPPVMVAPAPVYTYPPGYYGGYYGYPGYYGYGGPIISVVPNLYFGGRWGHGHGRWR